MRTIYFLYGLTAVLFVGWIANIVQIVNTEPFVWSGVMIAKIVGIVMPPLGSVMGIIGFF